MGTVAFNGTTTNYTPTLFTAYKGGVSWGQSTFFTASTIAQDTCVPRGGIGTTGMDLIRIPVVKKHHKLGIAVEYQQLSAAGYPGIILQRPPWTMNCMAGYTTYGIYGSLSPDSPSSTNDSGYRMIVSSNSVGTATSQSAVGYFRVDTEPYSFVSTSSTSGIDANQPYIVFAPVFSSVAGTMGRSTHLVSVACSTLGCNKAQCRFFDLS